MDVHTFPPPPSHPPKKKRKKKKKACFRHISFLIYTVNHILATARFGLVLGLPILTVCGFGEEKRKRKKKKKKKVLRSVLFVEMVYSELAESIMTPIL